MSVVSTSAALSNLEAAAFNLWLVANQVGAKIEHGAEDSQQLGRALRLEADRALATLFDWRRLRAVGFVRKGTRGRTTRSQTEAGR
jgi:hypothetical protein